MKRVLLCVAMLAGCGGHGVVINRDGTLADNTPEHAKAQAEQRIVQQMQREGATVAIASLPRWQSENRTRSEGWYWDRVAVAITVPGTVTESERDRISDAARRSLEDRAKSAEVSVTTGAPLPPAPTAAARQYRVMDGDTLADISTAFYGTPQHWRRILAANPGLDPAHMTVGTLLAIPPKP